LGKHGLSVIGHLFGAASAALGVDVPKRRGSDGGGDGPGGSIGASFPPSTAGVEDASEAFSHGEKEEEWEGEGATVALESPHLAAGVGAAGELSTRSKAAGRDHD
ncbi:unnamed protein product, partial [Pylaiella littoralis]